MLSLSRHAVASAVAAFAASLAGADVVAGWTIPTAFPTNPPPTGTFYTVGAANEGANTVGSELSSTHAAAAATYTSPAGNGSQYSFSSNNWGIGDYYEARLSTAGYTDITISWDQARSSTGPSSFSLLMSIDGGATFTTLLETYAVLQSGGGGSPGTWSSTSARNLLYNTVASATLAGDRELVIFRFVSLVAGASTGSNRIDNVFIEGTVIPAPGALALLGLAGLASRRRRR
jgi:hypothetical protein